MFIEVYEHARYTALIFDPGERDLPVIALTVPAEAYSKSGIDDILAIYFNVSIVAITVTQLPNTVGWTAKVVRKGDDNEGESGDATAGG